uniref:Putative ovule protein n=1 Tax=Solanum chacoense TaxID=4108 RepID=A0A0V0GRJ2_SOLCH
MGNIVHMNLHKIVMLDQPFAILLYMYQVKRRCLCFEMEEYRNGGCNSKFAVWWKMTSFGNNWPFLSAGKASALTFLVIPFGFCLDIYCLSGKLNK